MCPKDILTNSNSNLSSLVCQHFLQLGYIDLVNLITNQAKCLDYFVETIETFSERSRPNNIGVFDFKKKHIYA